MSKVAVVFTGGTIGMTKAAGGGQAVPALSAEDIQQAVPPLAEFDVQMVELSRIPSSHFDYSQSLRLKNAVDAALATDVDGVVVAHGTDTLEDNAFFLDLFHIDRKPVVFLGAMRTSDDLSWDGPINLYDACLVATDPRARDLGVLVVMNQTIHAAAEVTKTYTSSVQSFASPDAGPLGMVDGNERRYFRRVGHRFTLETEPPAQPAPVPLVTASLWDDGSALRANIKAGAKGIVVAAFGRGNVSPGMAAAIDEATDAGIIVAICSRCWGGWVNPVYGYPGGGGDLIKRGAFLAAGLNPFKTKLLLSMAIASSVSRDDIHQLLRRPYE